MTPYNRSTFLKIGVNFGLVILSFACGLILFEFSLRHLYPNFDPTGRIQFHRYGNIVLGPKGKSFRQWNSKSEYNVKIQFNKYGFRDSKDLKDSTPHDIFVVGDSYSFGHGVSEAARYSNLLESYTKAHVYNISIPGDFTDYLRLIDYAEKNGAKIHHLIIGVCMENDLHDYQNRVPTTSMSGGGGSSRKETLLAVRQWLMANTTSYHVISQIFQNNRFLTAIAIKLNLIPPRRSLEFVSYQKYDPAIIDSSVALVQQMARNRNGIVLLIPSRLLWSDNSIVRHDIQVIHSEFKRRLQQAGLMVIDMKPVFENSKKPLSFSYEFDGHWNARGHRLAAIELGKLINSSGFLAK